MERVIKLLDQYKIINISYEQLWQMDFQITEPFILKVDWDKVTYEFLIRIKPDTSNTIVLDRSRWVSRTANWSTYFSSTFLDG